MRCGAELGESGAEASEATVVNRDEPAAAPSGMSESRLAELSQKAARVERIMEENFRRIDVMAESAPERPEHLTLCVDRLCILFEGLPGNMRMRLDPGLSAVVRNVVVTLTNHLSGEVLTVPRIVRLSGPRPLYVQFPKQPAGTSAWRVQVAYETSARKVVQEGDVEVLVVHPQDAQKVAEHLSINISTNVTVGNASDMVLNQKAAEDLANLARAENPFDELRRIVNGIDRAWHPVELFDACEVGSLPPMPPAAGTTHVCVDLGNRKFHFFAGRTVRFGRKKELNDIALRPPASASESQVSPYYRVSRAHCLFESEGRTVRIYDGYRDESRVMQPSSGGTFLDGVRIGGHRDMSAGESGVLSFGGPCDGTTIAMDVRVCSPKRACATCPHAERRWCGEGEHSSLVLSRRDGQPETYVALWSCFCLGEVDASFENVVVFRKGDGFAFRHAERSGWLVPGTAVQTEFGPAVIS